MKIITKKKFIEETYNVDYELIKWLNEHLKGYLKYAKKHIKLDYYTFEHEGKTLTQEEMINRVIEITDCLLNSQIYWNYEENDNSSLDCEKMYRMKDEMYDILKAIHWHLWW